MLGKKVVYNGLSLELYTTFDFQLRTQSVLLFLFFLILNYQLLVDKQICFEIHHYL